jgi:hypothetical protein
MAHTTMYTCDFEGCSRALDQSDVTRLHLRVHNAQLPEELVEIYRYFFGLDLCDDHLDVVLARILMSATAITQ